MIKIISKILAMFWMRDKQYHLIGGAVIGLTAIPLSWYCALTIVFIIGFGKEMKDEYVYHGFDWYDLLYTMAGGVVSIGFIEFLI